MGDLKLWKNTVLKNYMDKNCPSKREVSQILNYIRKHNIKINTRVSYQSVLKKYQDYLKVKEEYNKNYKVLVKLDNHLKWVKIKNVETFDIEGDLMGNCLNKEFSGDVISLHNKNNKPLIHVEIQAGKITQIKEKCNKNLAKENIKYIEELVKNTKYKITDYDLDFIAHDIGLVTVPVVIQPLLSEYLDDFEVYDLFGHSFIKGSVKIKKQIPFDLSYSFMQIVSRLASLEQFFLFLKSRYNDTNHILDTILETFITRCTNKNTIDEYFKLLSLSHNYKESISFHIPWFAQYQDYTFDRERHNINKILTQLCDYETSTEFACALINYVKENKELISSDNIWNMICGFCEIYKTEYADKIIKAAQVDVNKLIIGIDPDFLIHDKAMLRVLLKNGLDKNVIANIK